jgi:hypothetical protein
MIDRVRDAMRVLLASTIVQCCEAFIHAAMSRSMVRRLARS